MNNAPHIANGEQVIIFDGVCKLCNAWSRFIIKHDKHHRFRLCSIQSPQGKDLLEHFGYNSEDVTTMLLAQSDRCYDKSGAFLQVMHGLGWPYRVLCAAYIVPRPIRDWLYDRIALNRYRLFGKYDSCTLPNPDHQKRFLDHE